MQDFAVSPSASHRAPAKGRHALSAHSRNFWVKDYGKFCSNRL